MEEQKRLLRKHILFSALCSSFLILLCLYLQQSRNSLVEKADWLLYDRYLNGRDASKSSGKVGVVLMDEQSARILERTKSGWSRSQMAKAVQNLNAAGAEVIALDLLFSAPDADPNADRELAQAIQACGRVVLARYLPQRSREENTALPVFQEGMVGDGFIDFFPDHDDILRSSPYFYLKKVDEGWEPIPVFALEAFRAFQRVEYVPDFSGPLEITIGAPEAKQIRLPKPELRIYYYGGADYFNALFYNEVVQNRFDPAKVKGKVILIGSSLALEHDFLETPLSRTRKSDLADPKGSETVSGGMEGVVCHANALETLFKGDFIRTAAPGLIVLLIVLAGVLGFIFYFPKPGPFWGLVLFLLVSMGLAGSAFQLFNRYLLWLPIALAWVIWAGQYLAGIVMQRVYARSQAGFVTQVFGKYISPKVVDDIVHGRMEVSLEGQVRDLTVFFSDLRDFTTLSERLGPQETQTLLNLFFDAMLPIVLEHEGTLDKLIGDAIMAFFGAPRPVTDHPKQAAHTALAILSRLKQLKQEQPQSGIRLLQLGIGLNTGPVTVGNLGSAHFMNYTVIGDTVNLASRLEGLNKAYGTAVIVNETTAERLGSEFVLRELDLVRVKGKLDAVRIFELVGFRSELDPRKSDLLSIFNVGLTQYRQKAWNEAGRSFAEALVLDPQDEPSRIYQDRVQQLLRHPPPDDWSPVITFASK
jgi:adenylate cyclase